MTTIHVRTEERLKKEAQHILSTLGLDLSTAVNLFLVQVKLRKGLPFPVVTEHETAPTRAQAIREALRSARRSRARYASAEEAHRSIPHA